MASTLRPIDVGKYCLAAGMKDQLMTMGFLGSIHAVLPHAVEVRLPCGEHRTLHFDLSRTTESQRSDLLKRWRRTLQRSYERCASVRFLATERIAGHDWRLTESSIILQQSGEVSGQDIKLLELFSGGYGGWSRSARFPQQQGFPIRVMGGADVNPAMSQMWAINDGDLTVEPMPHPPSNITVNLDDTDSWDAIMATGANAVSISSSCKVFSAAGSKKGWQSSESASLALALRHAALHHGGKCG